MKLSIGKKQTHGHGEKTWFTRGSRWEWDGLGVWGKWMQTIAFGVDKQ